MYVLYCKLYNKKTAPSYSSDNDISATKATFALYLLRIWSLPQLRLSLSMSQSSLLNVLKTKSQLSLICLQPCLQIALTIKSPVSLFKVSYHECYPPHWLRGNSKTESDFGFYDRLTFPRENWRTFVSWDTLHTHLRGGECCTTFQTPPSSVQRLQQLVVLDFYRRLLHLGHNLHKRDELHLSF